MRSLFIRSHALGLAVLVLAASSLSAREPRPALDVQTETGETTFHIGERIPLKLTFTSPNDKQYVIAPWSNGRGSEFDSEGFDVSPSTGWSDPLATYFAQDFPVYAENGVALERPLWLDTVNVPFGGSVDVIMDFTSPVIKGMSLFHCHLLNHEDKGMMAKVLFE